MRCKTEGDCRVAVNTAPRNDRKKSSSPLRNDREKQNVIASDSEAISCDFAPVSVEGDCRVAVNTAPRNDRKKVTPLIAMTEKK